MGGGDLNMKKSWHTSLSSNMEKVWLKEKQALEERKKLGELQKERQQERAVQELQRLQEENGSAKREERVDWMYAAPAEGNGPNPEELELYLLGKKRVDKLLKGNEEKLLSAAPSSTTVGGSFTSIQNANSARDTAAKIREDPLLAIKRQEQAQYEKILKNPKKLRELRAAREAGMTPHSIRGAGGSAHSGGLEKPIKKHKKDETKDERRIRKENKAREEGERLRERNSGVKRGRDDYDETPARSDRHDYSRRDDNRRSDRDAPTPRYQRRSRSRSRSPPPPPPPRHQRRSRSPPPPPPPPRRDNNATLSNYRPPPRPSASSYNDRRPTGPTPEQEAAQKADATARLEAMQSSAASLSSSRNARLSALESADATQLAIEEAKRSKMGGSNGRSGVGPSFLREEERKVFGGGMDLAERMQRSGRVGLERD